jgi:O-antigen/teichoic acid export membrane protein
MDSVALFGVGNKLPTHVSTVVTRGAIALLPEFARQNASQATLRRLYSTSLSLIIGGVLPVVVLGGVCAQPILQVWAGTPYLQAGTVMQWLLVAAFSFAIEHPSDLLLYGQGQVKVAGRMAIAESIANVVVSLVLASRYGAVGLAAGTAITHVIINVFWYTPTACRVLELSPLDLLKSSRQGLGWPVVLLLAEAIAMHSLVASGASAVTCVAVGVLLGLIYLLTWGFEVLLPLYRSGAEGMLHSSLLAHGGAVTE